MALTSIDSNAEGIQLAAHTAILGEHPALLKSWKGLDTPEGSRLKSVSRVGRIVIHGLTVPDQKILITDTETGRSISSVSSGSWPSIHVEYERDPVSREMRLSQNGVAFRIANDSVDGWLLHTRMTFAIAGAGMFSIESGGEVLCQLKVDLNSELGDRTFLQLARLSRRLKFIQEMFQQTFVLPDLIPRNEIGSTEIVFRGITEGDFAVRAHEYTFAGISPSEIDINAPPFYGCGRISRSIGETFVLFGRSLPVGPVTVDLARAELASPEAIRLIRQGATEPISVRFSVLDNQVRYIFEDFTKQASTERRERLDAFKRDLRREEPEELVRMIDDSLQNEVSGDEAVQIALGWQLCNDLPDRLCAQEAELDVSTECWRVPIALVFASGKGGDVGEVLIHRTTGLILDHTPLEEIYSRAKCVAERLLDAG